MYGICLPSSHFLSSDDTHRLNGAIEMTQAGRVWMISEVYYPEEIGTGYYMTHVAEGLAEHYHVRVLCSQPTYAARGSLAPWREVHRGVHIDRCRATTFNKDVPILRLINVLTISLSISLSTVVKIHRSDVVVVVTNPPLLPFVIAAACRLRGVRCILRVDDVYPEVLTGTGFARPDSAVVHALSLATRHLYRSVCRIVVLGRDMERLARAKLGGTTQQISVIPNWADIDLIAPVPKTDSVLVHELGLANKFVVQCAGNMGRAQGVENMLRAAELLTEQKDIHFLFIGAGAKRRWMEDEVKGKQLGNITLLDQRPRSDQPNFLNACDIAMASLLPGMTGAGVPSRTYNIMAAGKPIIAIANPDSELSLVVQEEQVGWVVPPDQPEKLVEVILEARAHPEALSLMGKRARAAAEAKYSPDRVISAYSELVRDVCIDAD
jgi:colanic acid biosynthesis glycosyl transferase WcaI